MTTREEQKAKEKAILRTMLGEKKDEEETPVNTFKAKPVPEHVKQPLFRQMVSEHPSRYMDKYKMAQGFTGLKRARSVPSNLGKDGRFKARPYPKEIFTDYAYEQMRESERYRDVRKALRQKALLEQSKWPQRMQKEMEQNCNVPKVCTYVICM